MDHFLFFSIVAHLCWISLIVVSLQLSAMLFFLYSRDIQGDQSHLSAARDCRYFSTFLFYWRTSREAQDKPLSLLSSNSANTCNKYELKRKGMFSYEKCVPDNGKLFKIWFVCISEDSVLGASEDRAPLISLFAVFLVKLLHTSTDIRHPETTSVQTGGKKSTDLSLTPDPNWNKVFSNCLLNRKQIFNNLSFQTF